MQHQGHVECHLSLKANRWPPGRQPRLVNGSQQELVSYQTGQVGAPPCSCAQERMNPCQRLNAASEAARKFDRIVCATKRVLQDRLDTGQGVLDAVVQLADEKLLCLLRLLPLEQVRGLTSQNIEQPQFMVGRTAGHPVMSREHPQDLT